MTHAPLLAIIATLLLALPMMPDRHRTTRRNLHRTTAVAATGAVADTVAPSSGMVVLSGYDKPLRSSRESIFATNRSRRTISAITLRIDYLDPQQRQLHSREVTVSIVIPPGETRQLTFRSWDRQNAFYYHLTGKPRTTAGSPYTIRATPTRLLLHR